MARIQLKIQGVTELSADHSTALIVITDKEERRQLAVVCNEVMRYEFGIRWGKYSPNDALKAKSADVLQYALPETLSAIIRHMTDLQLAVVIVSVFDGQYRAIVEDQRTGTAFPIRVSDGALLSYADPSIPLFIEESLWERQSVPYLGENSKGIAMPLNTLSMDMLKAALKKCIEEERYEMAQEVKKEIERRKEA